MSILYLASGSPRRKELLTQLGVPFTIRTADVDETVLGSASQRVLELAQRKALAVAKELQGQDAFILGADTLVANENMIFGKPVDKEDAAAMLRTLSGSWHSVYTGVCLIRASDMQCSAFVQETRVHMVALSQAEITEYIQTGEPMDKAGAYGIQGFGGSLIDRIEGDYYTVMGLPLAQVRSLLCRAGIPMLQGR